MSTSRNLGQQTEELAAKFLSRQGLKYIMRNFHSCYGEIDLIMRDKEFLVFVEVRYRQSISYGSAAETVTQSKQAKIIRAAKFYLQKNNLMEKVACRFDVVTLSGATKDIYWIKSAFELQ